MKKHYLNTFLCLGILALPSYGLAQQNNNALPQIPKEHRLPNIVTPGQNNTPDIDTSNQRTFVNPVDVIKEKENQNTRSGFWQNPNADKPPQEEAPKTAKEKAIERVELQQKLNASLKDSESEENVSKTEKTITSNAPENVEKLEKVEKKDAAKAEASESSESKEAETTSKTDETEPEAKQELGNNPNTQAKGETDKEDKELTKKQKREEAIRKINMAKKSMPLVEPPKRTWRLE